MKRLVAVAVALALVASAHVASAYVAVVGTAISVPSAPDAERSARLEEAIWAAIRDVLEHAVAFTPTVVTIEDARIVGDRLYLSIFLSDEGGESVTTRPVVASRRRRRSSGPGCSARLVTAVLAGIALSLAGCAGSGWLSGTAICEAAGGTYTGGTCSRWGPAQQAAQDWCETSGGVYLAGQEQCAFGMGGP